MVIQCTVGIQHLLLYDALFFLKHLLFNYIVGNQNIEHILEQPRNKSAYCKRDCVSGSIATTCINLYLMCFKTLRPHSIVQWLVSGFV